MRFNRRRLLGAGAGLLATAAFGGVAQARLARQTAVDVQSARIRNFSLTQADKRRFGGLIFRSGLRLTSSLEEFGGYSGLWRAGDGAGLVAVSDAGHWLTGKLRHEGGLLAALEDVTLAPILRGDGTPLNRTRAYDTEGLAIVGGVAFICIERVHQVMRFDFGKDGVMARGREIPVPRELKRLPSNKSLEAIGIAPPAHPLAGAVVVIAERSGAEAEPTQGAILTGPRAGLFQITRPGGFDITDLAFLPDGDMLVLERWYRPFRGVGMRIRRIDAKALVPGAMLDGEVLIEADLAEEIDNMEGLALHQQGGKTILTLISDDNFSALQRTILLEFELA
ncbi:MAG: esterase-like activity of phytase family protein [Bosea sp. (in: a-proteobacteria)]